MHLKVLRGWLLLPLAPLCGAKVGSCFASSALEYGIMRWGGMVWDDMG